MSTQSRNRHEVQQGASISTVEEMPPILEAVAETLAAFGYSRRDIFGIRLALEEAVVNAIKHGHRYDPTKQVQVRYQISPEKALLEVEDQGPGFDPSQVPDCTSLEGQEKSSGRGLLLMRSYLTWVRYNERGNRLTFCKQLAVAG